MHCDNVFELIIAAVFATSPQLGGLGPKYQDLVIPFCLRDGERLPDFHLGSLSIKSELVLMRYQTGQINKLTEKYIMELSKMKHIQGYINAFELDFRRFERQPQSGQLSIISTPSMEFIFENIKTVDIDINPHH